jgi:hypothetical protein
MMRGRKAIEVQFNWIFILIAGAIILAFFLTVYTKYRESKNNEIAFDALTNIRATLTSAQTSTDTAKIIDIPEVPLQFKCFSDTCTEEGCESFLEFRGTGIREQTAVDVVFAPDEIESNKLLTWTLAWEEPFKVADFLFLSNPKVRYVLVYNDKISGSKELALRINNSLSDNKFINTIVVNASNADDIRDENDYLVKFVFFFDPASSIVTIHPSLVNKGNWDVIFIYGDERFGQVKFSETVGNLKKPDPTKEYPYLGAPMLIGAIFSESADFYKCNIEKAYRRHLMVNLLYMKRTELLYNEFAGDLECEYYYDQNLIDEFIGLNESIITRDLISATSRIGAISDLNGKVLYKDCPRVY